MRAILLSFAFLGAVAVLLLSVAVWFVGPLLPIGGVPRLFDPVPARLTAIGVLVLIHLGILGLRWLLRRRRNARLLREIAEPDRRGEQITAEAQALRAKFADALAELRKLRFRSRFGGSRYVYELPWYVFIGPPASGKTTALLNCGLEFPLKRGDDIAIEGVAGTANCDWMFTDQAVFIDTAGRYVTRDSDETADSSAFATFLDLIARNRPGEALNGVIVAISIEDLAGGDAARLERHATAVRAGLQEIMGRMKTQVPVYVMFTKADLLKGFNEFFQTMSKPEREQVWGVTFPLHHGAEAAKGAEDNLARLEAEFDALLERLGERQFRRMQEEADVGVRSDIFGFPSQFSSLRPVVARFLREAFGPDRYSEAIRLRGFYFTSATQQGQPVDRLIASLSREFGLERRASRVTAPVSGRAYFLRGLLEDVVFPEAGLATYGGRRTMVTAGRWAAVIASALAPVGLAAAWWSVGRDMDEQTRRFGSALASYEADLAALAPEVSAEVVEDAEPERVIEPLDRLAAERERLAAAEPALPLNGLGAADLETLREQADRAYFKAVDDLFRPRLLYGLEAQMDALMDRPAALYDALKTYLMVGGRGVMDESFVRGALQRDWATRYDPEVQGDLLAAFDRHLEGMFEGMRRGFIRDRSLNEAKIPRVRAAAAEVRPAERALGILMAEIAAMDLPGWSLADMDGGRAAEGALIRLSGADLFEPVPGAYTHRGFWEGAQPRFDDAVEAALSEKWVLADVAGDETATRQEVVDARRQIRELYEGAYIETWTTLLEDFRIAPFGDAGQAAEVLRTLASGRSPLRALLIGAARETDLANPPEGSAAGALDAVRQSGLASGATARADRLTAGRAAPGQRVSDAFVGLRDFVGSAAAGSPLEGLLLDLGELRAVVADMAAQRQSDLSALAGAPAADKVARAAETGPQYVSVMISEMAETFRTTVAGGLREQLNEQWRATVAPYCRQRLSGRYPFGGGQDVALGDLSDVLGPGGLIDGFFEANLASMVDRNRLEWTWKGLGLSLGIPADRLKFFQTAAELRDAFFPDGNDRAQFRFGVFPEAFDPEVTAMQLEIGGASAEFQQSERGAAQMAWPGPVAEQGTAVTMTVDSGARDISGAPLPPADATETQTGAFGLFRMADASGFGKLGAGDRVRVRFRVKGRSVNLILAMESATNPFALRRVISGFECPSEL